MNKSEPIRIAQVIGKWVGGGVEAVVMNYYRHIDHSKIQFDFFCDEDSTNIPYEEIESLGGKVILIPPYQKIFRYQKELRNVLKSGGYKIIHSHINTLSVFPLYAAKKVGVPIRIAHSHSTSNKREWKKNFIKNILKPFSKLFANYYMCCSEHAGRWLFGKKEYDKGNVFLLNNAIDLEKFKYNEEIRKQKREELNISKDTLIIGHVGRFVEQKNHRFLLDVFNEIYKENQNVNLILVGQGPLMDEMKLKAKNLGLENNVKFLGQRDDVNELYQVFDIFLFPSLYEGLGMVCIEAQVSGLPVVASTEVPRIAKVTSKMNFLDLNESPDIWSELIINLTRENERKSYDEEMTRGGYNILEEATKLEKLYLGKM